METQILKLQHLNFIVKANQISIFLDLIQSGFKIRIKTGLSVKELLCVELGISDDYLDNRIQTLFLDGKPVDNVDVTTVFDGSRIALSAAMPGLVGATFRKGGAYAAFRASISYINPEKSRLKGEGEVTLIFFNMVAKELGPAFLQTGVIIDGKRFQDFVERNAVYLNDGCNSIHLNDAEITATKLKEIKWENRRVFVQVKSEAQS